MQTTCPQCHITFPISLEQLRAARGTVECGECQLKFNALQGLHDEGEEEEGVSNIVASSIPQLHKQAINDDGEIEASTLILENEELLLTSEIEPPIERVLKKQPFESEPVIEPLEIDSYENDGLIAPWDEGKSVNWSHQLLWVIASIGGLALLLTQFYLNEMKQGFQNQTSRSLFDVVCPRFGCQLPPLQNISAIDVVDRSIQATADELLLNITLANHAVHSQPFPHLKLTLSDARNQPFSQRTFGSDEYLPKDKQGQLMAVDVPIRLQLAIVPLNEEVTTFSFELL